MVTPISTSNSAPPADILTQVGSERRDFLYIATGAVSGVGAALTVSPLIDNLNPSADVLAVSAIDVNVGQIQRGQRVTVKWRGNPVFIDYRTEAQIEQARMDDTADLIDPQRDADRVQRAEWLVVTGVCTHLGCVPLGQREGDPRGDWGGWFCPCHGSQYDTSGRVRRSPAPKNLYVPPYKFVDDRKLHIG